MSSEECRLKFVSSECRLKNAVIFLFRYDYKPRVVILSTGDEREGGSEFLGYPNFKEYKMLMMSLINNAIQ